MHRAKTGKCYQHTQPTSYYWLTCWFPSKQKVPTVHSISVVGSENDPNKGNLGFIHAFVASFSVIIVSELGDKTFFIAAIMAMRYNRFTVLVGAMLALSFMTCLSGKKGREEGRVGEAMEGG